MTHTNGSRGGAPRGKRMFSFRMFLSAVLSLTLLAGPTVLVSCGGSDPEPEREARRSRDSERRTRRSDRSSRRETASSSRERTSSRRTESPSRRRGSPLEREVAGLLEEARDSGASEAYTSAYRKAKKYYDDARDEGDERRATPRLERAKSTLTSILSDYRELQEQKAELTALVTEAETAKQKAEEAGAKKLAALDYEDAMKLFDEARKAAADATSARDVKRAGDDLKTAAQIFEDAITVAKENEARAKLAEAEREAMVRYRDQAKENGADVKAITDWAQAERSERRAAADMDAGRFQAAIQSYQQAAAGYLRALESTLSAEQMAKLAEENRKRTEAYLQQQKEIEEKRIEAEKATALANAKARAAAIEAQKKARPVTTPLGTPGSLSDMRSAFAMQSLRAYAQTFDPSIYKQELDPVDEEFLNTHYSKLASTLQYDPATGVAHLDLTSGADVRKDFKKYVSPSLIRRNYLTFINTFLEGSEDAQSFMANTEGTFLIPIPFKYRAKVEWDMSIQTMDANGTFNVIMMYDEKKSHYMTNWVHWQSSTTGGHPKTVRAVPGKYGGSANYWFDKTRDVGMRVEFKMPGEDLATDTPTEEQLTDTASMTVAYDTKLDPLENTFESERPITSGGFVGFKWHRVKFTVKKLQISGILDKQRAVKMLRGITGISKKESRQKAAREKAKKEVDSSLDSLLKPTGGGKPEFDF